MDNVGVKDVGFILMVEGVVNDELILDVGKTWNEIRWFTINICGGNTCCR